MQQIERLKMIDELLNKIPSNLTEMSDPSTKTPIPRVEDIRPGLTPLTFQSPPLKHTRNNGGASSKGAERK
jgi:hypothetical protein